MSITARIVNTLFLVFALVSIPGCPSVHPDEKFLAVTEKREKVLRFGGTNDDYILWYTVNTTAIAANFSVCTWLMSTKRSYYGTVFFHYSRYSIPQDRFGAVILGGEGYWNEMVGASNLKESTFVKYFNIATGNWYHVCWTWNKNAGRLFPPFTTVYLNGNLLAYQETNDTDPFPTGGNLYLGTHEWLGRYARSHFGNRYNFVGDMYKLNVYNRVLSELEISSMASDICSTEEERLTESRVLRWEDMVALERTGNVTEYSLPGCLNQTQKIIWLMEQKDRASKVELRNMDSSLGYIMSLTIAYIPISTISLVLLIALYVKLVYAIKLVNTET